MGIYSKMVGGKMENGNWLAGWLHYAMFPVGGLWVWALLG